MDLHVPSLLARIIAVGWRRRFPLLLPLLLIVPVSVIAARTLPGVYVARSLVLLQESNENPLSREPNQPNYSVAASRNAALRALLWSEYVLGQVVDELRPGVELTDRMRAGMIKDLRDALALDNVGTDFLEFRLAGGSPTGLGKKLETVMSRFVEALTTQGGVSVGELVLQRRKQELEEAERAYDLLKDRVKKFVPEGTTEASARVQQAQQQLDEAVKKGSVPAADGSGQTLELSREEAARVASLKRANQEAAAAEKELAAAAKTLAVLKDVYETFRRRYGAGIAARGSRLLNAPERMIVIDAPTDPLFRSVPAFYYVVYGIAAGILLGLGLAVFFELLDGTVRSTEQLTAITGVPVLARIPHPASCLDQPALTKTSAATG